MAATKDIAEFVVRTNYSNFDTEMIEHTKVLCLRGLGMALAGTRSHAGQCVINYIRELGYPSEAGVVGAGFRTSVGYAAMVNGTTSHATELEDDALPETVYLVGTFPAAFALGEKMRLSGKQVIEAITVGFEVASRLASPCLQGYRRGFCNAAVFSCIGVAALTAKILNLGVQETMMALSIAASQASGLQFQTGEDAHLLESGTCGRDGIEAAMLAKQGCTGQLDIFDRSSGLCDIVAGVTEPQLDLGVFRIKDVGFRKFPCCRLTQNIINGCLELIRRYKIAADAVESVRVDVWPAFLVAVRFQHPTNENDARFCLPHHIASCLIDGQVSLDSFSIEKINDKTFHALREKVNVVVHPEWELPGVSGPETPVTIRLKDGREYRKSCPSSAQHIVSTEKEVMDTYMDCALRVVSPDQAKRLADLVLALDTVEDVSEVMSIATFPEEK